MSAFFIRNLDEQGSLFKNCNKSGAIKYFVHSAVNCVSCSDAHVTYGRTLAPYIHSETLAPKYPDTDNSRLNIQYPPCPENNPVLCLQFNFLSDSFTLHLNSVAVRLSGKHPTKDAALDTDSCKLRASWHSAVVLKSYTLIVIKIFSSGGL